MNSKKFKQYVIAYGNGIFDCGEWDGTDMEEYLQLSNEANAKRKQVLQAFDERQLAIDNFCDHYKSSADVWKKHPVIKALFDLRSEDVSDDQ